MARRRPTNVDGDAINAPVSISSNLQAKRVKGENIPLIRQVREYELITPLFGGGTEPQKADPVSVLRGPSIRGQLRFWWRAIRGGQFGGSLKEMKEVEDAIFGSAGVREKTTPSQVQIELTVTSSGKNLVAVDDNRGKQVQIYEISSPYGYAAFPLREKRLGVVEGISFSLSFAYPAGVSAEVEAAIWAFEMFGGIGGRTRRGFGALQLKSYRPDPGNVRKDIEAGFGKHFAGKAFPANVPHLDNGQASIKITKAQGSVSEVWKYLIKELKEFRQDRRPVNPETRRPGRSYWPEPDEIRSLTGRHTESHKTRLTSVSKFPRAAFGLPIIFQFNPNDVTAGDPRATTLEGRDENQKRMASPVILRPLACFRNQGVGLAVVLSGTALPPGGIILKGALGDPAVQANVTADEAKAISPLRGQVNVLQAFLSKLK